MRNHLEAARSAGRQGTLWVFGARMIQNCNGLLLSILLVRQFGIAAAGTLALATTAIVVSGLVGTLGLTYTFPSIAAPIAQRNALGFAAAIATIPISLPPIAALGFLAGRSHAEADAIVMLALGGPFFAQCNLVTALQILNGRPRESVIPALANLIGLAVAAALADSLLLFAAIIALFRSIGIVVTFLMLPMAWFPIRAAMREIYRAVRYLPADLINLGTDQLVVLGVSAILSRGELGVLGLCRQLTTVSDTPGWSHMQTVYPSCVAHPDTMIPKTRNIMLRLGVACGALFGVLAVPLGLFVYHVESLSVLAPLLLAATPLRSFLSVQDLRLRATGAIRQAMLSSTLRCVVAVLLIPAAAMLGTTLHPSVAMGGAVGAVLGMILLTVCSIGITAWISRSRLMYPLDRGTPKKPALASVSLG